MKVLEQEILPRGPVTLGQHQASTARRQALARFVCGPRGRQGEGDGAGVVGLFSFVRRVEMR